MCISFSRLHSRGYKKKQSCFWKQLRFDDNHNVSSVGASDFDLCYCYSPVVGMVFCTRADVVMNTNLIMTALELLIIDCNRKLQVNPSTLYQKSEYIKTDVQNATKLPWKSSILETKNNLLLSTKTTQSWQEFLAPLWGRSLWLPFPGRDGRGTRMGEGYHPTGTYHHFPPFSLW